MKYLEARLGSRLLIAPIRSIYLGRQTGILEIFGPKLKKRLYFVAGELHLRRSELPATARIAAYVEHHDNARQGVELASREEDNGARTACMDDGLHVLTKMIAEHWMVWNATCFRFIGQVGAAADDLVGPLPTASLLLEAAAAASPEDLILQELGGLEALVRAVPDDRKRVGAAVSGPERALLMDLCKKPVRLREVLERAGGPPPTTLKALSLLWAVGLIRPTNEEDLLRVSLQERRPDRKPEEAPMGGVSHSQTREIWLQHFRLTGDPFSLTPDPAFLYLSKGHTEALAALQVGVLERRGLNVLIGEVGTGKTTLLYSLLSGLGSDVETAYVANTTLSFDEILRAALRDFGVETASHQRMDLIEALNDYLLRCRQVGKTVVLVVDESQALSAEAFEGLRQLLNFETCDQKLLQVFLVGQPELGSRLREQNLRQVADRIALRCHLGPLRPTEARKYIQHRLDAVGASSRVFTRSALSLVVRKSRCVPRSINVLCHNAMLSAFARGVTTVDRSLVREAVRERAGRGEPRVSFWRMFLGWRRANRVPERGHDGSGFAL
ncbi:MAG: AAA family ATPase [bacterium]|nr:AAA family ATPase [bacterium]